MFKIMLIIYRYFHGYINVVTKNTSPERLFNMFKNLNVDLWNVKECADEVGFNILVRDFKKNKRLLKKANVKWKINGRWGLPFILYRNRHKKMLTLGTILSLGIIYYMSGYIWSINIEGNYSYTYGEITDVLSEINVKTGIRKNQLSGEEIEKFLRNKYFDINWVSVEIKGTVMNINIKENFYGIVSGEIDVPCHIVAAKDGVVNSIITRNGVPMVKAGDEVKKGDILISGTIQVFDDYGEVLSTRNETADGDVYIDVTYDYNETIKRIYSEKVYTGKEKEQYFVFFNRQYMCIKAGKVKYEKYDTITEEIPVMFGEDFIAPVGLYVRKIKEVSIEEKLYNDEELTKIKDENLGEIVNRMKINGAIYIKCDVKSNISDDGILTTGKIYVSEPAIKILEII